MLFFPIAAFASDFRLALPGYHYDFPRDHFAHPGFRTEWWYYTGNLTGRENARFGFELVFFRQAVRTESSDPQSAWGVRDLYLAHLALTDAAAGRFRSVQRLNRAGPGIAGASFELRRVWNGNWSAEWEGGSQVLQAVAPEFRFRLKLNRRKPPVIHGRNGVSQKAEGEGKASHYVSLTRLAVTGNLEIKRQSQEVTGLAWMDHEWFTHQLESTQAGWDWFSIQLDDGRDLMLFQLRRKDGSIDAYSSGTLVDAGGQSQHLDRASFRLKPLRYWESPASGARYPVEWTIEVPRASLNLTARALLDNQELSAESKRGPRYWEGAVTYTGSSPGVGYLEMTGYDKPVSL